MTISMHAACAPTFERLLGNMLTWLDKAQAHAQARKFSPDNYLAQRLTADMLPLVKQVQIAADAAKGCMSRLAGQEIPKWDDNEATLDDLRARIRRTIAHVQSIDAAALEGSETREIVIPRRTSEPLTFNGLNYLQHYALPNFFFHTMMVYTLLRQTGVELGKQDYLVG